ncbi:HlyD family secretion protein, partial [Acinetobacter baumannii]|uniref:HlyD family secretion protein n=1 Tax=Acinetobacter baumannii TaxID=470 RepID=UPI0028A29C0C
HFVPLLFLPVLSPLTLMALPILLSRLFNDRLNVWAPVYQYDAILAPQQGITRDAKGDATALVVDAANKVEQRTVETGDTYGDKWLVLSGLKAGDKLIVEGTGKVAPGQTVKAVAVNNNGGNA